MKLDRETMQMLHRGELTPKQAFRRAGAVGAIPGDCRSVEERYRDARAAMVSRGSDDLVAMVSGTDALLERMTAWSRCEKATRMRRVLALWDAERLWGRRRIDIVYTLGTGSKYGDDLELRLSLRSWLRHFWEWVGRIWIVGACPDWLRTSAMVRHVPATDAFPKNKDANLFAKLRLAAERDDISDPFIWCSDDQVLMRDATPGDILPYYRFDLMEDPAYLDGGGRWRARLRHTAEALREKGLPTLHYDAHVPMPMRKADIVCVTDEWPVDSTPGYTVNTLIGNVCGWEGVPIGVRKMTLESRHAAADAVERLERGEVLYLGFNDEGFTPDVAGVLLSTLPPVDLERHAAVCPRWPPTLPAIDSRAYMPDTALILTYYGKGDLRREAVRRGLSQLLRLNPRPRIVLLEATMPGRGHFHDLLDGEHLVRYEVLEVEDRHRDLMQKEALFNLGVALCPDEVEVLIFGDPDSYPASAAWAGEVRATVKREPAKALQPYSVCVDTGDRGRTRMSYAWRHSRGDRRHGTPGLYWAFSRELYERFGGWNPWCISGAGDCMFVWEHIEGCTYDRALLDVAAFRAVYRDDQVRAPVALVPAEMIHCYHGPLRVQADGTPGRGYRTRWAIIDHFGSNAIRDHVELDACGLLAWKDPACAFRRAIRRKGECDDVDAVKRVLADADRGVVTMTRSAFVAAQKRAPQYYTDHRWRRYCELTAAIRALPVEAFRKGVFEAGPSLVPLVTPSVTMDIDEDAGSEVVHDACKVPWPVESDRFTLAIASHVLEHLGDAQPAAIAEMARVAEWLLIALPYKWRSSSPHHNDIDFDVLIGWVRDSGVDLRLERQIICDSGPYGQLIAIYRRAAMT